LATTFYLPAKGPLVTFSMALNKKALGNFSKKSFEKLASGTQQIDATD
jgi:hypothetical protein